MILCFLFICIPPLKLNERDNTKYQKKCKGIQIEMKKKNLNIKKEKKNA